MKKKTFAGGMMAAVMILGESEMVMVRERITVVS